MTRKEPLWYYYDRKVYPLSKYGNAKKGQYVYLIKNPASTLHKVGITEDVERRRREISCNTGTIVDLIAYVYLSPLSVDEPACNCEKTIHAYYKDKRQIGEWFLFTKKDVNDICKLFVKIEGLDVYYPGCDDEFIENGNDNVEDEDEDDDDKYYRLLQKENNKKAMNRAQSRDEIDRQNNMIEAFLNAYKTIKP